MNPGKPTHDTETMPAAARRVARGWRVAAITTWALILVALIGSQLVRPLPDVRGLPSPQAVARLNAAGFVVVDSSRVAGGKNVWSWLVWPDLGSSSAQLAFARVALYPAPRRQRVQVPQLAGLTDDDAVRVLADSALSPAPFKRSQHVKFVMSSIPSAGTTVDTGSSVRLVLVEYHGAKPLWLKTHGLVGIRYGIVGCVGQCHWSCRPCHTSGQLNESLVSTGAVISPVPTATGVLMPEP